MFPIKTTSLLALEAPSSVHESLPTPSKLQPAVSGELLFHNEFAIPHVVFHDIRPLGNITKLLLLETPLFYIVHCRIVYEYDR